MPSSGRPVRLAGLALVLAGVTCSFPTDKSEELFVTVALDRSVVVRGQVAYATAYLWRRVGADSAEVKNAEFLWSTNDPAIATVKDIGFSSAEVTGVNSGLTDLAARAVAYEASATAFFPVRVANTLEIDSIRPDTARWGQKVTVHGVGIRDVFFATLGAGVLFADTFSFQGDREGLGQMQFWVPLPSHSSQLFMLGAGVFTTAAESTFVRPFDIYEPNETSAWPIDLDAPGPFPALPSVLFFNPALALEPLRRDQEFSVDWYRFRRTNTAQPMTFILRTGEATDSVFTFLTDSIYFVQGSGHLLGESAWTIGSDGTLFCHGSPFKAQRLPAESVIVALRELPDTVAHVFAFYNKAGPYGITVVQSYLSAIPADRFEENDICNLADKKFQAGGAERIVISGTSSFSDTMLTIDNPHDVDWYRFRLEASIAETVTLGTVSRAKTAADDRSDIDLYLLYYDAIADTVAPLAASTNAGSAESITFLLNPGDYYFVVTDFAGQPVRYAACAAIGLSCALPPPPPLSTGASSDATVPAARLRSTRPVVPGRHVPLRE